MSSNQLRAKSQTGGHGADTPYRFPCRYLTQQKPTGKTNGLPRYYWSPNTKLVRLGFRAVRVPANWKAFTDGQALLEAAVQEADQLNLAMDHKLAADKAASLEQMANTLPVRVIENVRSLSNKRESETLKTRLEQALKRENKLMTEVARLKADLADERSRIRHALAALTAKRK